MSTLHEIIAKLNELAEVRAAATLTRADYETQRAEILKTVQHELDALDVEYAPLLEAADERAAALEAEIKEDAAEYGASVKGDHFHAVYNRGRVTWDTRRLDRYAAAHPEVLDYRKEGAPSVAIRTVKEE